QQPPVGVFDRPLELRDPLAALTDHLVLQISNRLLRLQLDFEAQNPFLGAAADRQHAMRGNLRSRFAVAPVHLVLAFRILGAFDRAADYKAMIQHELAYGLAEFGVLADPLGEDMSRAFERLFRGHREGCSVVEQRRASRLLVPKILRQRLESLLPGARSLSPTLRLER